MLRTDLKNIYLLYHSSFHSMSSKHYCSKTTTAFCLFIVLHQFSAQQLILPYQNQRTEIFSYNSSHISNKSCKVYISGLKIMRMDKLDDKAYQHHAKNILSSLFVKKLTYSAKHWPTTKCEQLFGFIRA